MGLFRNLIIFDFETTGTNPLTCEPVQVAAIVIDPRRLIFVEDSEFNIVMRPPSLDEMSVEEYMDSDKDLLETIKWHANNRSCTPKEVTTSWKNGTSQREAWDQFIKYVDKYNWKHQAFFSPIPGGMNIRDFDLKIYDRLNERYNIKKGPFWPRDRVDLLDLCFYWFEDLPEPPKDYKMDTLREWFGISAENAHDALQDVKDTGRFIIKFMRLHRSIAKKVKFQEGFKHEN